jgi:hypothetical protein
MNILKNLTKLDSCGNEKNPLMNAVNRLFFSPLDSNTSAQIKDLYNEYSVNEIENAMTCAMEGKSISQLNNLSTIKSKFDEVWNNTSSQRRINGIMGHLKKSAKDANIDSNTQSIIHHKISLKDIEKYAQNFKDFAIKVSKLDDQEYDQEYDKLEAISKVFENKLSEYIYTNPMSVPELRKFINKYVKSEFNDTHENIFFDIDAMNVIDVIPTMGKFYLNFLKNNDISKMNFDSVIYIFADMVAINNTIPIKGIDKLFIQKIMPLTTEEQFLDTLNKINEIVYKDAKHIVAEEMPMWFYKLDWTKPKIKSKLFGRKSNKSKKRKSKKRKSKKRKSKKRKSKNFIP